MLRITNCLLLPAITLLTLAVLTPLYAQGSPLATPPDSGLYTAYSLYSSGGQTTLGWSVCGSTENSEGCYAAGQLGPFVAVGGILESNASVNGNVVTRAIYVVDSGSASVKLYVYKKVDTVTADTDTVTVTLIHTLTLPLTGASTASCSMAANAKFLFIGTDQSELAAMVQKSDLSVTQIGSVPGNVISITSDQYGYVTVNHAGSPVGAFDVYGPTGTFEGDGGGFEFVVGTTQAVPLASLGGASVQTVPRVGYGPKATLQKN